MTGSDSAGDGATDSSSDSATGSAIDDVIDWAGDGATPSRVETDTPSNDGGTPTRCGVPSPAEYVVPSGAEAATCPVCERPFPDADILALHRGLDHDVERGDSGTDVADDVGGDAERRTAIDEARAAESKRLRLFRLKALVVLVVLYFGLLMVYAVVT